MKTLPVALAAVLAAVNPGIGLAEVNKLTPKEKEGFIEDL